jgi:hypothetical protein
MIRMSDMVQTPLKKRSFGASLAKRNRQRFVSGAQPEF